MILNHAYVVCDFWLDRFWDDYYKETAATAKNTKKKIRFSAVGQYVGREWRSSVSYVQDKITPAATRLLQAPYLGWEEDDMTGEFIS